MPVKLLTSLYKEAIVVNLHNARAVQAVGPKIRVYYAPVTFKQKLFSIHDIDEYKCNTEQEARQIVEQYLNCQKINPYAEAGSPGANATGTASASALTTGGSGLGAGGEGQRAAVGAAACFAAISAWCLYMM